MAATPHPQAPGQSKADYVEELHLANPGAFGFIPPPPRSGFEDDDAYIDYMHNLLIGTRKDHRNGMIIGLCLICAMLIIGLAISC